MNILVKQFNFLFEWIAKFILYLFGWKEIDMKNNLPNKYIIVSHNTSKWDLFFLILYKYANYDNFKNHILITNNNILNQIPKKLKSYTDDLIETMNGTNEIVDEICEKYINNKLEKIIVTPFVKDSYTNDFYKIAKILNLPIIISGLDYEEKKLKIYDAIHFDYNNETEKDIIREIKNNLKNIIPLNAETINLEYRSYNKNEVNVTNNQLLIFLFIFFIIIMIYIIYRYDIMKMIVNNGDKIKNWIL
jgi:hypothetical protein